jgi:hypothetical protein
MITNPDRQRHARPVTQPRPVPRARNTTEHRAAIAGRLTDRDRWIARMLWEHRVLTSHQITALTFTVPRLMRLRMRELYLWGVVDRFQPRTSAGSAPQHYLLGPTGAAILAGEDGIDVKTMGYRHDLTVAFAYSLRLAHTLGVNDWFTALVAHARAAQQTGDHAGPTETTAWWSETRCARHFGDLVRPDAYGRWAAASRHVEFFLEFDLGTEALPRLARKLAGYAKLAETTGIVTPLLFWLPSAAREAGARRILQQAWRELRAPRAVPIATAHPGLIDPTSAVPSPAARIWLPLDHTGATSTGQASPRHHLHRLHEMWPHLPEVPGPDTAGDGPDTTASDSTVYAGSARSIPAPRPMPPARHASQEPRRRFG